MQRKLLSAIAFSCLSTLGTAPASAEGSPTQPWAACLKSHETGIYVTPAFRTSSTDYMGKINADASERWGSADYVSCDFADSPDEADRLIRNHYTTAVSPWPLPWAETKNAEASKKAPKSLAKADSSTGGYLVVEDKSKGEKKPAASASAKSTNVRKTAKSVDKGSNKSKCHLEGKRFVCPASKQ